MPTLIFNMTKPKKVQDFLLFKLPVTGFPLESVTLTTDWVIGFPLASKRW